MFYEIAQATLTSAAEIITIAGIMLILAYALYTQHCKFMSEFCPPVAPIRADSWAESKTVSRKPRESKAGEDFRVTSPAAWGVVAA